MRPRRRTLIAVGAIVVLAACGGIALASGDGAAAWLDVVVMELLLSY